MRYNHKILKADQSDNLLSSRFYGAVLSRYPVLVPIPAAADDYLARTRPKNVTYEVVENN